MANFTFSPTLIEAEAGTTLEIKLTSAGNIHDFVIDELDVQSNSLNPGASQTITIEIPEDASGKSFEFYCSIGNHQAMGMKGTLKVN
jgi:uncharacterized cupredoxin-like copper-binding protein